MTNQEILSKVKQKKYPIKEYVVYRLPDGSVWVDWNGSSWKKNGQCVYCPYPQDMCTELERGYCEGGINACIMGNKMREKYRIKGEEE